MPLFYAKAVFLNAICKGDIDAVRKSLSGSKRAKMLSARGKDNSAVMHLAISWERFDIAELLIHHGADVNAVGKDGRTPLHYAAKIGSRSSDIINLLVSKGADINARDSLGNTPAHLAVAENNADGLRTLAELGADLNAQDGIKNTPLHDAVEKRNHDMAAYLISQGVRTDIKGYRGATAHSLALDSDRMSFINLFNAPVKKWVYLCDDKIAQVETLPALSRKITEIFNFHTRERMVITENLSTGVESTAPVQHFDDISDTALAAAAEALRSTGRAVPAPVSKTRLNKPPGLATE
jgi:26S proteasome non-ATPase regulatory subunit 10